MAAALDAAADFVRQRWQTGEPAETIIPAYAAWVAAQAAADGVDPDGVRRYEVIVPSFMQVSGLIRYFQKREG